MFQDLGLNLFGLMCKRDEPLTRWTTDLQACRLPSGSQKNVGLSNRDGLFIQDIYLGTVSR